MSPGGKGGRCVGLTTLPPSCADCLDQCFRTFLLADPFWFRKITTDPHILAYVNVGCLNDGCPKLYIYISELQVLLIFERKIFRRIYGPKYEDGEWKSRTNRELEELSKGENIVKWIKEQRISWLGHLERMEEDRMPKKIFTQEVEGTRRRGRPRKGWREEVERDLQVLEVRRWRELVIDREKWRGIVRQAKAHSGL